MISKKPKDIDSYLAHFDPTTQKILESVRKTIQKAAPKAEEVISYQMPAFKFNGKIIAYFAGFKNHVGMYPPVPQKFKKEVAKYAGPKGNLQFPLDKPMPLSLIKKIVAFRVKELKKVSTRKKTT